jgi:alpha-tubulin suppressor-like RCC1 family protein
VVGDVYCWGQNFAGQLGNGRVEESGTSSEKAEKVALPGPASTVSMGFAHSCALLENGRVFCWGGNHLGQSGLDPGVTCTDLSTWQTIPDILSHASPTVPIVVPFANEIPLTGVTDLKTVKHHNCAQIGYAIYCWGSNCGGDGDDLVGLCTYQCEPPCAQNQPFAGDPAGGQLQITPSTTNEDCFRAIPVKMETMGNVQTFGLGFSSTFAIRFDGSGSGPVYAWGANGYGQLGLGSPTAYEASAKTVVNQTDDLFGSATNLISSEGADMCAKRSDGWWCWGVNQHGELGWAPGDSRPYAWKSASIPKDAMQIARGDDYGCALSPPGSAEVWCWGRAGRLGNGEAEGGPDRSDPVRVFWP